MKRILWMGGMAIACLAALAALAFAAAVWMGERKTHRSVFVKVVPVPFASGPAALKLGKYIYETRGCAECHGANGAGRVVIDEPNGMFVRSPNLTRGAAGAVAEYAEADWVRAIRHGVNPRGHALLVMPSEDYSRLTDEDLGALVAYVRSLPPVAGVPAQIRFPLIVRALYGADLIQDATEKINHALPPAQPVAAAASVEHGDYVAKMCVGCHGERLAGGKIPGGPPHWPPAANLTPGEGTAMARYDTEEKFAAMMRSGKRPDGSEVSKVMPFESLRQFNDTDLAALYAYLRSLAPRPVGTR